MTAKGKSEEEKEKNSATGKKDAPESSGNAKRRVMQVVEIADDEDVSYEEKKLPVEKSEPTSEKPSGEKEEKRGFWSKKEDKTGEEEKYEEKDAEEKAPLGEKPPFIKEKEEEKEEEFPPESKKESGYETPEERKDSKEVVSGLFHKDDTAVVGYPDISVHKKSSFLPILLWIVVILAVVGGIMAALLYFKGNDSFSVDTIVSPSAGQSETPTPSSATIEPTPTTSALKRSDLTIAVLNGSGKAGAATKMKELLEEKGYMVESTGNAKSFDYDETEIYVKSGKKAYLDLLKEDLKDSYTIGSVSSNLDEDSSASARIIIGKE